MLPKAPWESAKEAYVDPPRLRSCRFPVKVMYMAVVGRPIFGCDGKVFLKRVSITKKIGIHFIKIFQMNSQPITWSRVRNGKN